MSSHPAQPPLVVRGRAFAGLLPASEQIARRVAARGAVRILPNVAFLDIGLPVMDGYELAAHLRAIAGLADIQLVAVTGFGQESDRQKTRTAGFLHHLVKPVDFDAVEATLVALEARDSD